MSSHDTAIEESGAHPKVLCQAAGCETDVRLCGAYCVKRRVCLEHLKADVVIRRGCSAQQWRFCQQCGKFELLSKFDGARRSCREQLQRRRQADAKHSIRKKVPKDHGAHRQTQQKPAIPQFLMSAATSMSQDVTLWMQQQVLAQQQQIQLQEQQIKQLQALCQLQHQDMENTDLLRQAMSSGGIHEAAASAGPVISDAAAAPVAVPFPLWPPAGAAADTGVEAEHIMHQLGQQGAAAVAAAATWEGKQSTTPQMPAAAAAAAEAAAVKEPWLDAYHQQMHPLLSTASEGMSAQMHSTAESAAAGERHVQAGSNEGRALFQHQEAPKAAQDANCSEQNMLNQGNGTFDPDADHLKESSVPPAAAATAAKQATRTQAVAPGSNGVASVAPTAPDVVLPYWSNDPDMFTAATALLGGRMPGTAANAHTAAAAVPAALSKTEADLSFMGVDGDSFMALLRDLPSGDTTSMSMSMDNMTEMLQAALAQAMGQQQQQQQQQYEGELEIKKNQQLVNTATTQPKPGSLSAFCAPHLIPGVKSGSNDIQQQQPVLLSSKRQTLGMCAVPMTRHTGPAVAACDTFVLALHNMGSTAAPNSFDDLAEVLSAALDEYAPDRQLHNAEHAAAAAAAAAAPQAAFL